MSDEGPRTFQSHRHLLITFLAQWKTLGFSAFILSLSNPSASRSSLSSYHYGSGSVGTFSPWPPTLPHPSSSLCPSTRSAPVISFQRPASCAVFCWDLEPPRSLRSTHGHPVRLPFQLRNLSLQSGTPQKITTFLPSVPFSKASDLPSMRRGHIIFIVINLMIIGLLVNACSTLISLLFEDASADAILRAEIPAPGSELIDNKTLVIPKIIHQTYINESIPAQWKPGQQACLDLHQDYEYKLWTDKASRQFIASEYPWFLETFDNYAFPIQRADAIRYFVLAHYGGVYIDLDDGCNRRLDPLLSYPAWVRRTVPTKSSRRSWRGWGRTSRRV